MNSVFVILPFKVPLVRPLQNIPRPIQLINCTKYTEVVERETTGGNNSTDISVTLRHLMMQLKTNSDCQ